MQAVPSPQHQRFHQALTSSAGEMPRAVPWVISTVPQDSLQDPGIPWYPIQKCFSAERSEDTG
jgi:hypothetical protein